MALSNMQVFNSQVRTSMSERLAQEVDKFNAASGGTIVLRAANNAGDFAEETLIQAISGLVRRRDVYATSSPSDVTITELLKTSVRVAAGTPAVNISPSIWRWIGENPDRAGIIVGEQLAEGALADMLNTAIGAFAAAAEQEGTNVYDGTAGTMTLSALNKGCRTMGDRAAQIRAWIMHSKSWFDILDAGLTNSSNLFTYGTVRIQADALGNQFVVTDSDYLIDTGDTPDTYKALGLVSGGIVVDKNNDFDQTIVDAVGGESIVRKLQAEWTWNLGMKGYSWNKTTGGKSPTTAELTTGTNWAKITTSAKDLAGVLVLAQ